MSDTAIATVTPAAAGLIAPDLNAKLAEWRDKYHVLSPATQIIGGFAPGITLTASIISIDPVVDDKGRGADTYFDSTCMSAPKVNGQLQYNDPKAQRALNKIGLMRVAQCGGVTWSDRCGRRDDRRQPYLWEYYAEGEMLTPDGQWQTLSGVVEIDLRDGSPQIGGWTPEVWEAHVAKQRKLPKDDQRWSINGWSDKRVIQARRFGLSLAESKAKLRAIRSMGIQSMYTVEQLAKPFVVLRAVYQPGADDPEGRRAFAERVLHGRRMLYPGAAPAISSTPTVIDAEIDPEDPTVAPRTSQVAAVATPAAAHATSAPATSTSAPTSPATTATTSAAPERQTAPAADALRIVQVKQTTVTRRRDGATFPKWVIVTSTGEEHSTVNRKIGELAEQLRAENAPVDLTTSENDYGSQVEELCRAEPRLPLDGGDNY